MASYSAKLEVDGQQYPVVRCTYSFTQATAARGRVNERVRHGLLELVLDVPAGDQLLLWAATPHYPLDGHVSFYQASEFMARETVSFKAGQCVSYQEVFEAGADLVGAYRCALTIAAPKLELTTGSPVASSSLGVGATASLASAAGSATQVYTAVQQAKTTASQVSQAVSSSQSATALAAAVVAGQAASASPALAQSLFREDNFPFSTQGKDAKRLKSFIDEAGNLRPANPTGKATIQDHVRGSEPRKSDSPYTSTSAQRNVGKSYGDHEIRIDQQALAEDIANGQVAGVEIISHAQVVEQLVAKQAEAQARYNQHATPKNKERLARAEEDITNATRDQETLVKGVVPAKYVNVTKKTS